RRVASTLRLSPAVMRAGTVQVCVASTRASRRAELIADLQRRLVAEALFAPGPPATGHADQAVIVHPHPGAGRVHDVLRDVQARQPGLYVAATLPVPLAALPRGH